MKKLKFIDLFAGIGGIRLAFESEYSECVFSSEWDKNAQITYNQNFNEIPSGDITKIDATKIPDFDILLAGFPCQPFSIAGYQKGFDDDRGRGNVFFDIIRIIKEKKPSIIFLENVKNLKTHDKGKTFETITSSLENLGYHVKSKVLNTMEYGNIPQNRERIYIVGFKNKKHFQKFNFPNKKKLTKKIQDCLDPKKQSEKYYYNDKPLFEKIKNDVVSKDTIYQWRRIYVRSNKKSMCPTLTANMGTGGHNVPIILDNFGIRKLTPRECANFQGFPKSYRFPNLADSALYKQIGNSVSIPVVKRISTKLIKIVIEY